MTDTIQAAIDSMITPSDATVSPRNDKPSDEAALPSGGVSAHETAEQPEIDDTDDEEVVDRSTTSGATGEEAEVTDESDDEADDVDEDDFLGDDIFDATNQERVSDDAETAKIDTSTLGDDLKLSVTVDGEDREVTLGDLKKRYAGEGAIEKRLQDVTEARTVAVADYEKSKQLTQAVMQEFGQALFRRTVPEPTMELLSSNPQEYMRVKALFDNETQALTSAHQKLHGMMQQIDAVNEKTKQDRRKQAATELRQMMPVFSDPVRGPKVRGAIISAAQELGYSTAEIAECDDPRLFKTMALAAQALRNQKKSKVEDVKSKARSLPQRGANRKPVPAAKRTEKVALKRARETGAVDDIAASMLVSAPKKRRR